MMKMWMEVGEDIDMEIFGRGVHIDNNHEGAILDNNYGGPINDNDGDNEDNWIRQDPYDLGEKFKRRMN